MSNDGMQFQFQRFSIGKLFPDVTWNTNPQKQLNANINFKTWLLTFYTFIRIAVSQNIITLLAVE